MQKYLALWLGAFLLCGVPTLAQIASGNVAESSNPRSDLIAAQNFLAQRTIPGCVMQQGSHYLLVPRHGRPEELTFTSGETLSQIVGHQVKATGRETYAGEGASPDADYAVAAQHIEQVAQSCPANWNEKWVRLAAKP
jgi:hypothetical protein